MLDTQDSTLSSAHEELDELLLRGFPAIDGESDEERRRGVEDLAMAVAYTWVHHDRAAQEVFLDRLVGLDPKGPGAPGAGGLGLMIAVDVFTKARLFGIRPGALRSDQEITTQWAPPENDQTATPTGEGADAEAAERDWTRENIAVITDLWTGVATGDTGRMTRAKVELYEMPLAQVREVLRIMAYDASIGMEQFAIWQAGGADAVDDYRLQVPIENTFPPPPPPSSPSAEPVTGSASPLA